jgi:integrase
MSQSTEVLRSALRSQVILQLPPQVAKSLQWSKSRVPTVLNLSALVTAGLIPDTIADGILRRFDMESTLESQNSTSIPSTLSRRVCPDGQLQSLDELEQLGQAEFLGLDQATSTRTGYWRMWCSVVTWAVAHNCIGKILPMSENTLKALATELLALQCSGSYVVAIIGAISDRHRRLGHQPPIPDRYRLSRFQKGLLKVTGTPRRLKFPIQREHLVAVLSSRPSSLALIRDKLMLATMTICCLRASEVVQLQSCDIFFDFDHRHSHNNLYNGTAAVIIRSRKNDQLRKGHFPRIGRSQSPRLDLVYQLRTYLKHGGIKPHPLCTKKRTLHARCPYCPPLFPNTAQSRGRTVLTSTPLRRQRVREILRNTLLRHGFDPSAFSSVSARKGGLSVAIEAGVPEHILWLQSGHAQNIAARRYVQLTSPTLLYHTWAAFEL